MDNQFTKKALLSLEERLNKTEGFPICLYHLHITLKDPIDHLEIDGQPIRFTKINLPYGENESYLQYLTVYKATNKDDVIDMAKKICSKYEVHGIKVEVIMKVEDILNMSEKDAENICYIELHIKDIEFRYIEGINQYFSFSNKNKCFMNAIRLSKDQFRKQIDEHQTIYHHYNMKVPKQVEACIFEEWNENIEKPWIEYHHQLKDFNNLLHIM